MESPRPLLLSRSAVILGLIAALALVFGTLLVSTVAHRSIADAQERATHAQSSLLAIQQVRATITEAETGQRGYLLTRDETYLQPYREAAARYENELAALAQQLAGHVEIQSTRLELDALLREKFNEIAHSISLRQRYGIGPALNVVESDAGARTISEIRTRLNRLEAHELDEMSAHSASAVHRSRMFQQLSVGLVALTVLLGIGAAWWLVRRIHELEKLVTVCAWTHRVKWQGRWMSFEEYLDRRFNLHFTHGMSDEAAEKMQAQIRLLPPIEDDDEPVSPKKKRNR
ncbi:MAG: CHASE3 domain-containing protein [Opitutus sp.]|nr:CHASE3 domain-containing protein [Opitutus sp.]